MNGPIAERLEAFVAYTQQLRGDEKGEAQVFCDRLFQAFGHAGYKEAGAVLEERVRGKHSTKFADLVWRPRLLLEMKKAGEHLDRHYRQAFDYWVQLVPNRPRYVVLCNFREFWIYDFDLQLDESVDVVALDELPKRYQALNFLFPEDRRPLFQNDRVAVTRAAADKVAMVFNRLVERGENRVVAQRFVLQSVVAMFSEDAGLLPRGLFTELVRDCDNGGSSYDLLGGLFRQMNSPTPARAGRYQNVRYFNGGLFREIQPVELDPDEVALVRGATREDWSRVQPAIFGSLFESSMGAGERHAYGAHFTSEADIQKVVSPTIVRPWRERIEAASTLRDLLQLRTELSSYRVLDPACGSGNFLYIAYRELKRLEIDLLVKLHREFGKQAHKRVGTQSLISTRQFFGIDNNAFAVELAKVTLMLAKELALDETRNALQVAQQDLGLEFDAALPLDNLDDNILCEDALFNPWPAADVIIGNPPYQSKNKMQQEYGRAYLNRLRDAYPDVPGRADYCVYWFRKAHDALKPSGRAGLVGTNTIRQNYSREGGLDYIVGEGGTITEAVGSQAWSGDAAVHVSIVNWIKGDARGDKKLYVQKGERRDGPWESYALPVIGPSLSPLVETAGAERINANASAQVCYQGQTHGHEGFLLSLEEAEAMIDADGRNAEVLFPYLTGDDVLTLVPPVAPRCVIDFFPRDVNESASFVLPFERVKRTVLPDREKAAAEERRRNEEALRVSPSARTNKHHENFLSRWWYLSYPRPELMKQLAGLKRYIACSRVTKRPVFVFVDAHVHPSDALQVFALEDDYSFGILQSTIHWEWFKARCSTLTERFRYTSDSVFDTFPWPQTPSASAISGVAKASRALRDARRKAASANGASLRDLYRTLDLPGDNPLKSAQSDLDRAVRSAYEMGARESPLDFLLRLNADCARSEAAGESVTGPGVPTGARNVSQLITSDSIGA
jgi:SAM-dependent methyltransferase